MQAEVEAPAALTRKGSATRKALLNSTILLIASRGYAATTTQAVLDHSGVSRGSLLHQFRTRDLLVVHAAEEALLQMMQATEDGLQGFDNAIDALHAYPEVIWQIQNEPPARAFAEIQLASRWQTGLREGLRRAVTELNEQIAENLRSFAAQNNLRNAERLIAETHALISATQSLAVSSTILEDEQKIRTVLDVLRNHYYACIADVVSPASDDKT